MRPHWLNALGPTVNRFTGGTQIRHFVIAITGESALMLPTPLPIGDDRRTSGLLHWIIWRASLDDKTSFDRLRRHAG